MAQNLDFGKLVPNHLKNDTLDSLISNLFNRFTSQEDSVQVEGYVGQSTTDGPSIQENTLERQINGLIPALTYSEGTEKSIFTFEDMLDRMKSLGIKIDSMRQWMSEQTYNFTPPINYDKFINYSNYYWVGSRYLKDAQVWNSSNSQEYYVIARPKSTDSIKLPVRLATSRNINLQINDRPTETFVLTFTSSSEFDIYSTFDGVNFNNIYANTNVIDDSPNAVTAITVSAVDGNVAPAISDVSSSYPDYNICTFSVVSGSIPFQAGDQITISVTYFTSQYSVAMSMGDIIGKGTVVGIDATISPVMFIDGIAVEAGDRILVTAQTDISENGIYQVSSGSQWNRTIDASENSHFDFDTVIFVEEGLTNAGKTFTVSAGDLATGLIFESVPNDPPLQLSDWQLYNYWYHKDDLHLLGLVEEDAEVAIRPIIEYDADLELNNAVIDSVPTIGNFTPQHKSSFNQIPQFNLYRYDGSHANMTSGIFFYEEDSEFPIDSILQKRVKTTVNSDYVFGLGVKDQVGRHLFFKKADALISIWRPGVTAPRVSPVQFFGGMDKGQLTVSNLSVDADNQHWTITFINPNEATIVGTRSGNVGTIAINSSITIDDFELSLTAGVNSFAIGETFTFAICAPISPRYVKEQDGQIINYPSGNFESGYAADNALPEPVGAWACPLRMFQNLGRQLNTTINYADMLNHARSVLRFQDNFVGSSYGNNNSRNIDFDPGLGGEIREFGSNFPLLASMLIHKDLSPITILDFAERQNEIALSSIDRFMITDFINYLTSVNGEYSTSISTDTSIKSVADYFESLRAVNVDLASVFSDTTSGLTNWPASMADLGLVNKSIPGILLDQELNQQMIRHHDGHRSALLVDATEMSSLLVRTLVQRSDGTETPGVFSNAMPMSPFSRQLWMNTDTAQTFVFNVNYDSDTPPNGKIGETWFKRSTNTLYNWDDTATEWVLSSQQVSERWIPLDIAAIRNSLVLELEDRLYAGVHPSQQVTTDLQARLLADVSSTSLLELELFKFAAIHNLDAYAPDYDENNAFTWNYSSADYMSIGLTSPSARWYDIYKSYFSQFTPFEVSRPDIEPWKLGSIFIPAQEHLSQAWVDRYASTVSAASISETVQTVATANIDTLAGLPIINNVQLVNGDKILLTAQTVQSQNGIYVISNAGWFRSFASTLSTNMGIQVNAGNFAGSVFVLTTQAPIVVDTTALVFEQERIWNTDMWVEIKALNPTMKILTNVITETLLPPYVSATDLYSTEALFNIIPPNVNVGYQFGDNGPVELIWKKSSEYFYSLARVFFKLYPLEFLDKHWGETYLKNSSNLRLERNLMASLPSNKFLLHGEALNVKNIEREISNNFIFDPLKLAADVDAELTLRCTHVADNLTVFTAFIDGQLAFNDTSANGEIIVGQPFTITSNPGVIIEDVVLTDLGIPFNIDDTIVITFSKPIIEYEIPEDSNVEYGELGCEGCVVSESLDPEVIVSITQVPLKFSIHLGQIKIFKGIGQIYTNLLRFNSMDSEVSNSSSAYRSWQIKLIHRLGALVRPDSLRMSSSSGIIPDTGYEIILRSSKNTESKWISALRVQLVQIGERTLNTSGLYVPKTDAADWVFRVEVYNPIHPEVFKFTPVIDDNFTTFHALDKENCKLDWKHYETYDIGSSVVMPQQITGLQNTINFIFGYVDHLTTLGFNTFSDSQPLTDAETGRNLNWQLEVEKLIDSIYSGMNAGDAYILNPFIDKLILSTPEGLMGAFTQSNFMDIASAQCCFNVLGEVIPVSQLFVIRTDEQATTYSEQPIYSAHIYLDKYEHVIVLQDKASNDNESSLLFDSFLGEAIKTAKLAYTRQANINSKPTFDGFYLRGDNIARNISSSVDSLQTVYDPDSSFNEPLTASHAMSLVGFSTKEYFDNLDITPATQMNFWRSMISSKGTNLAISAFTNYKDFSDSSTDEFWAYKVGTYGDAREKTFPEIKIQANDATKKFTSFQFYDSQDSTPDIIPQHILVDAHDDTRWFSIDDLGTNLRFDAVSISESITVEDTIFPQYVSLKNIYSTDTGFKPVVNSANAEVVGANTLKVLASGTFTVTGYSWINQTKLSPVKLIDYKDNVITTNIGLWHPAMGVHAYSPLELINIKDSYDPACYNYTRQTIDNPNYKVLKSWDEQEVGKIWWDTSKLSYVPYYDANIFTSLESRLARWGALAEYGSIDLYEWTESPVHPSEYNELAKSQEGDISIDSSVRLSGEVGFQQFYKSEKTFAIRPIAWSMTSSSNNAAHPSFGPATFVPVYVSGDKFIIDSGRAANINIIADNHFAAWDEINSKPVGEVIVGDIVDYDIGSELLPSSPVLIPGAAISELSVSAINNTTELGTHIGAINLVAMMVSEEIPEIIETPDIPGSPAVPAVFKLRMSSSTGEYQDVIVEEWNLFNDTVNNVNSILDIMFDKFGIKLTFKRQTSGVISSQDLCIAASSPLNDIYIRETVNYILLSSELQLPDIKFSNNPADNTDYGWKVWQQPTQLQLNADLPSPFNKWKPYIGDLVSVSVSADLLQSMQNPVFANLTLPRGITINRYEQSWSDWTVLSEVRKHIISDGISAISFTIDELEDSQIDTNRLSVYVNGIQIAPADYVIIDNTVNLVNILPEANSAFLLYRSYEPTPDELEVDEEDPTIQTRYRKDYQYTKIDQRSFAGNIIGAKYYFWVKNKSVVRPAQSMSMRTASAILRNGESTYIVFSQLTADDSANSGAAYDSCTIAGLHSYVNDNDRYKLRFLRDFTLRDDQEELSLKNVHTEWELLRPGQLTKIPASLWLALTNSICGFDAIGNSLPAKTRIDYDAKYNTRTRYGFAAGQIFCETTLALDSVINTLLNTSLTIQVGANTITDYVTMFNINSSTTAETIKQLWFANAEMSRNTMSTLYRTARASQVNEIFFDALNEALANNFEFTDLFKTSLITVNSSTVVKPQLSLEYIDEFF